MASRLPQQPPRTDDRSDDSARAERLLSLLNDAGEAAWDSPADGGPMWRSPGFTARLADLPDRDLTGWVHREDRADWETAYARLCSAGAPLKIELRLQTRSGGYDWFSVQAVAYEGGVSGIIRSVGALRTAQRDLQDMTRSLRRTRIQAERAIRAKTDFLATMSYEIRTPLNGVLGMVTLLMSTGLNVEQRRCAESLWSSGGMLLGLVNDILDFSRLESGRMELEIAPFSLRETVNAVYDILMPEARAKKIRLEVSVDPAMPDIVMGDATRLRQVLLNLAGNAVKFTDKGFVRIEVGATQETGLQWRVAFRVTDTGIGVPRAARDRIFQRFTQADSSTARRFGGTGLGLAICRQIVDLMEGEIGMESDEGQGSRFWFSVPLAQAEDDALPQPIDLGPPDPAVRLCLLLAEDNEVNQIYIATLLRKSGHTVDIAEDGRSAVAAVGRKDYDAVLMDVHMPAMDGVEATKAIRALADGRGAVPVIALTANAMQGDRERYLESGMNDYVSKPVQVEELSAALARATGLPVEIPDFTRSFSARSEVADSHATELEDFLGGLDQKFK